MPRTTPIDPSKRQQIGDDIAVGFGRNDIARRHGVSPGLVSKIARERGLGFRSNHTFTAAHARQIDMWSARVEKGEKLLSELFAEMDKRPGPEPTRREKRLSYALYNLNRHHNGTYRT